MFHKKNKFLFFGGRVLYMERGQADYCGLDINVIGGGNSLGADCAVFVGSRYSSIYIILPNRAKLYERNLTAI